MMRVLQFLLLYLYPAVDEPEAEAAAPEDDPALDVEQEPPEGAPEGEPEGESEGEPARESRASRDIRKLRERLQESQRELEAERRRGASQPTAPTRSVDTQFEQEEARLRDPACSEWERWQIQSNRTIRATRQESQQTAAMAADMADRAAFISASIADPRMKRYQDRVEAKFQELKGQGKFTPRDAIYTWMLGEDVRKAKPKPKGDTTTTTTTTTKPATGPTAAQRGQPAGRRSDVTGKAQQTERDKRRARLDGVNI